jgi:NADH-quinone oxidoreductase subunit N
MTLPAPSIEYGQLAPMLIVFGAAVAGALVEGFLPRGRRYAAQLAVSLAGLVGAFVAVVVLARDLRAPGRAAARSHRRRRRYLAAWANSRPTGQASARPRCSR